MNFRPIGLNWLCAAGCGVFLCLPTSAVAQGRPKKRSQPIIFSETQNSMVLSNLDGAMPRKEVTRNLDKQIQRPDDLLRPSESFGSIRQPAIIQPPPPNVSSRRIMDLIRKERERKDWALMEPEDSQTGLTAEEIMHVTEYDSDGQEKKKATPLEAFMERRQHERNMPTNQMGSADATSGFYDSYFDTQKTRRDDDSGPLSESKSKSRKTMATDPDGLFSPESVSPGITWNPFGVQTIDGGRDAGRDSRMQDFNNLFKPLAGGSSPGVTPSSYDPTSLGSVGGYSPLAGILPATPSAASASSRLFTPPAVGAAGLFGSTTDPIASPSRPLGLPEVTVNPISPSLTPVLPTVLEPPRQTMPQPVFSMPQRKF